ncbi:bifunctional DNA primase/polymerase [Tepidiforma sp.]|uniref:bifunctional DNA primase/polymerase n=1 Tax=Tepidiforma sp. TaxID=2682230 RepID=UPI0026074D7E|nr:bifunctional DNA primase/polymerase [Tepidiforma sp.]MCX7618916.1 bifunctional DNA primase/polymerase [Tepidiforma sp.]
MAKSMVDAALEYARLGWAVLPLHTPRAGICSCRRPNCENTGKHPRTRNGVAEATTDPDRIRTWWGMWPDANIGIACKPSNLTVLDIDPRHGGEESLADLRARLGEEAFATVTAITGSGGQHIVYRTPPGAVIINVVNSPRYIGPLGAGIDVRSGGGLTSQHGGYIVAPPSLHASGRQYAWEVSPWEQELLELPQAIRDLIEVRLDPQEPRERVDTVSILQGVDEGERDWQLFRLAAKLRQADVPFDVALRLVLEAAANCRPPFPKDEALRKVESAYRYPAGRSAIAAAAETPPAGFRTLLGDIMRHGSPPVDWVVEPLVVRGMIHLLYGEPESGKTILALRLMSDVVSRGEDVVFVDEESGPQKIADLLVGLGTDPDLVDQHLHYFPFPSLALETMEEWLCQVEALRPSMVAFDSLTDMLAASGIDENKGHEVNEWMVAVAQRLARTGANPAVLLVDHVAKDTENVRYSVGSRAKKAKSDVMWYVRRVLEFDRQTIGRIELIRHKNRPGVLEPKHTWTIGGCEGALICRPFSAAEDPVVTMPPTAERILEVLREGGPCGVARLVSELEVHRDTVHTNLQWLLARGYIQKTGNRKAARFSLAEASEEPPAPGAGAVPPPPRQWWMDDEDEPWE